LNAGGADDFAVGQLGGGDAGDLNMGTARNPIDVHRGTCGFGAVVEEFVNQLSRPTAAMTVVLVLAGMAATVATRIL